MVDEARRVRERVLADLAHRRSLLQAQIVELRQGMETDRDEFLQQLVALHYSRDDVDLSPGRFRVRGDVIDVSPAESEKEALRIQLFDDEIRSASDRKSTRLNSSHT